MDRHLLRRTTLGLFILVIGLPAYAQMALPPRQNVSSASSFPKHEAQNPRQNHAPPTAWSDGLKPDQNPIIAQWIGFWLSEEGRARLASAAERSFPFRQIVNGALCDANLPWELAAIPIVESNWRIDAVSSSGAVGPWQFLAATARGRNLVIDAWRDERRDVWKATQAAMEELAFYKRLQGDWPLAIASYNAGPTRIRKLRETSGLQSYWQLLESGHLPPETQSYVAKILAAAYVTSHAGRLEFPISWNALPQWEPLTLTHSVPWKLMAKETGIPDATMTLANAALMHPVTPPTTGKDVLYIPKEQANAAKEWLAQEVQHPQRFWKYTVQQGDSLSVIARRSGMTTKDLIRYNEHVSRGILRIGVRLYIPGSLEKAPIGAESDGLPSWSGRYRVRPGDSMWSVARRFGIQPQRLAEANSRNLTGILLAGSVLTVPRGEEQ
ncbi:MAG: LysM peptidoglycan-binding domain-containing protein [Spirochaetales bacterium]|nr:LysM peptidoglycan-binding domain-containing protein [Spirochaetales bacterium]